MRRIGGVGLDIVDVERIGRIARRHGSRFLGRIFGEREAPAGAMDERLRHAIGFAVKEAFLKALGTGLRGGVEWRQIAVRHLESGRPTIELTGRAKELADERGVRKVWLSVGSTALTAAALVVLEVDERRERR
jgi:holo-[acyl-carrier protein] synthase